MSASVAVLGSGSWGTALAILLARNGVPTALWGREADALKSARENTAFLPGIIFPESLEIIQDFQEAVLQSDHLLVAVPSIAFASVLSDLSAIKAPVELAWATKGLDHQRVGLLSDLVQDTFPEIQAMTVVSGPSFAKEVAEGVPSAITVASSHMEHALTWSRFLNADSFYAEPSDDIIGVQIASAVKNVIAIASGLVDGLGLGANTRCALITQGLAEMKALAMALGAKESTFMSLAGIGDLMLTATDNQSRNRRFGLALGQGQPADAAENAIGQVVEGRETCLHVAKLAREYKVDMPIVMTLEQLFQGRYQLSDLTPLWFMPNK